MRGAGPLMGILAFAGIGSIVVEVAMYFEDTTPLMYGLLSLCYML